MANKNPDPARQSAGGAAGAGGNNFQSRAAAWWLGQILLRAQGRGSPFGFPHAALPIRIAAQTGDATDDLRISFAENELYVQCKTSLSVSTDWPLTGKKKNEFASVWIQFYRQIAAATDSKSLALALNVAEASGPIRNLHSVLHRFRNSPAGTPFDAASVAVTEAERAVARKVLTLFAAFAKDNDLPGLAE